MRASSSDGGMQHSGALINLGVKHLNKVSASDFSFFVFFQNLARLGKKIKRQIFLSKKMFKNIFPSNKKLLQKDFKVSYDD